jgi:hypothetical protein
VIVDRYQSFCQARRIPYLTDGHYNLNNLRLLGTPATATDGTTILVPTGYTRDPDGWEAAKIGTYAAFANQPTS